MASFKSQLFNFAIRNRHFLHFRLKQEVWDWNTSIPKYREQSAKTTRYMAKLPEGITVTPVHIDGLPEGLKAEWIVPSGARADCVILYTHGGAYICGDCNDHRALVSKFALAAGVKTLLFDYRLAPEHPFPAALEDTLTVYRWLLSKGYSPANLIIAGESAGGGLCLATLLALRDTNMPLPAAAVAMSPWTDLTYSGESFHTRAKVCVSPEGMFEVCSKYYAGDNDPRHPWISPLFGDLHHLPPIHIVVGDHERMLDDSTAFVAKAKAAGVEITLRVGEGQVHCYPLMAPMFPEATEAMNEICMFIKSHLGKEAAVRIG